MEPSILYEDLDLIVLNKPSGMTVNRADTTTGEKTMQDWVETSLVIPNFFRDPGSNEMLKRVQHDIQESDFYKRAGIVHRLDKETSGILLVAKTPQSFENLQKQFKDRIVKKTYLALVHGKVVPEIGEINVPVGRLPWNKKQFGIVAGGRESLTRYRVIQNYMLDANSYTLLELYPETGRTHQIRVHLKHVGHPIFGDSLYAGRKTARNDRKILSRVFLHASKISFIHPARNATHSVAGEPRTGEVIAFESPLPEELQEVLNS